MGSFGAEPRLPEAERGPGAASPGGVKGAELSPFASLSPLIADLSF